MNLIQPISKFNITDEGLIVPTSEALPVELSDCDENGCLKFDNWGVLDGPMSIGKKNELAKGFLFNKAYEYPFAIGRQLIDDNNKVQHFLSWPELVGNKRIYIPSLFTFDLCGYRFTRSTARAKDYQLDYFIMGLYDQTFSLKAILATLKPLRPIRDLGIKLTIEEVYRVTRKYTEKPWTDNQQNVINAYLDLKYDYQEIARLTCIPLVHLTGKGKRIDIDLVQSLYNEGMTPAQISKEINYSVSYIRALGLKAQY